MSKVYIIDIMTIGMNNFMVHDVASVWDSLEGAHAELKRIAAAVNDTEVGLMRAKIDGDRCSVESSESGRWRLLSRYHIITKSVNS